MAAKLDLKVVPGASRNQISGWLVDRLKVRVHAPPESGKANKAVIKLLAKATNTSPREIQIISGGASPLKTVQFDNLNQDDLNCLQ
jgi:uncharacterized protein (TIGR00251 family)